MTTKTVDKPDASDAAEATWKVDDRNFIYSPAGGGEAIVLPRVRYAMTAGWARTHRKLDALEMGMQLLEKVASKKQLAQFDQLTFEEGVQMLMSWQSEGSPNAGE